MATFNLPPRQKMINLLYVILIAMLAINISSEVLDGFVTANRDMERNVKVLQEFHARWEDRMAGQGKDSQLAEITEAARGFSENIGRLKEDIRNTARESSFSSGEIDVDDDLNAVRKVMLEGGNTSAGELKAEIERFREQCLALVEDEAARGLIADLLDTEASEGKQSWEMEHFADLPAAGGVMMLSKIERDVWLAANEAMRALGALPQDSLEAPAVKPETELDNDLIKSLIVQLEKRNENDRQNKPVVKDEAGKIKAVVLTENQAPLFAGYENVIDVTVASGNAGAVRVELTDGTVRKVNGHYVAIPDGTKEQTTLTVKQNGRMLVEKHYRVVSLPVPKPYLTYVTAAGKKREYRSNVPLNGKELASMEEIGLKMEAGIDTKETVREFDMIVVKNGNKTVITEHAQGGRLTANMKRTLKGVVKGDKLFFTNIVIKGEHTQPRQTISLNVIPM